MVPVILLILITVFIPPLGVFLVRGCGADLLINICLTLLGYLPGHVHAFYIEYVEIKKRETLSNNAGYGHSGAGYSTQAGGNVVGGPRDGYAQQGYAQGGQMPAQGQTYGTTSGKM